MCVQGVYVQYVLQFFFAEFWTLPFSSPQRYTRVGFLPQTSLKSLRPSVWPTIAPTHFFTEFWTLPFSPPQIYTRVGFLPQTSLKSLLTFSDI